MARRGSHGGRVIDMKQWLGLPGLSTTVSTDTTFGAGQIAFTAPFTILRMIIPGGLFMFDENHMVNDTITFTIGIGVISTDAVAANALPDPSSEANYPWLWWTSFDLIAISTFATEPLGSTVFRVPPLDSRSMRKVKPGQSLITIFETNGAVGAPETLVEWSQIRVLLGS